MADARLADGSRVNVVIPPLAVDGPALSIRRFGARRPSLERLVEIGTLSAGQRDALVAAVRERRTILVSGGTGSGKTTLLNALSEFIGAAERVITIEDAAELRLVQEHVVRLETRPASVEGRGEVTIRDLLRNALRMRPDRIVIGEVRGPEALDLLTALNTGHEGALSTVHANSPGRRPAPAADALPDGRGRPLSDRDRRAAAARHRPDRPDRPPRRRLAARARDRRTMTLLAARRRGRCPGRARRARGGSGEPGPRRLGSRGGRPAGARGQRGLPALRRRAPPARCARRRGCGRRRLVCGWHRDRAAARGRRAARRRLMGQVAPRALPPGGRAGAARGGPRRRRLAHRRPLDARRARGRRRIARRPAGG